MTAPNNPNLAPNLPPQGPSRVVFLEANRPPTVLDSKYRDGSFYQFDTEWRDKSTTPPNVYKLVNILSKTNAVWVLVTGGTGTIINIDVDAATAPGVDPVSPSSVGLVTITGGQVAASTVGANVIRTHTTALNQFAVEIQRTTTAASQNSALNGVSHFNSAEFTVDANGFVSLSGGGQAIDQIAVDTFTGPGTNPVLPTGAGQVTVTGAQVAPGTIGANVIRTDSLAANTYTIEIQQTSAVAAKDTTKNGVSHFNSAQFTNDQGFISLVGGSGSVVQGVVVDAHTGPGTSPVLPNGSGNITVTGAQVAAGTVGANAIRSDSLAANTYTVEIQRAAAAASSSVNNNGICSFDNTEFTVDANGWVKLIGGSAAISSINVQRVTATGAFTYTPSAGTKFCICELAAGGGGSGGVSATTANVAISGAGSGGGYAKFLLTAAQIGASLTGSVGIAGTAGASGNNAGGTGGNTTLATAAPWTVAGGTGGAGGAAGASTTVNSASGGTVTTGTGTVILAVTGGQSGTGAGAATTIALGGAGGANVLGAGGPAIIEAVATNSSSGHVGMGYGSGAGASVSYGTAGALGGTAGQQGIAIFTEFI